MRGRRLGDIELVGHLRKAAPLRDLNEDPKIVVHHHYMMFSYPLFVLDNMNIVPYNIDQDKRYDRHDRCWQGYGNIVPGTRCDPADFVKDYGKLYIERRDAEIIFKA